MSPQERQQVIDLAQLQINQYFDHYLSEVFPKQMKLYFDTHSVACPVKRRVDRFTWTVTGMSALLTLAVTLGSLLYYWYNARPQH